MFRLSTHKELTMTCSHFRSGRLNWLAVGLCALLHGIASMAAPPAPPPEPASGADQSEQITEVLRGIVVVPGLTNYIIDTGITGVKGVVVKGPEFLKNLDFEKLLARELDHKLTKASMLRMQTNIINYCRKGGHLLVDVVYPQQEVTDGTIQIAVLEGRIDHVTVANKAFTWFGASIITNRAWFKNSIITNQVRLKPGEVVKEQRLNEDLNWVNRNTHQDLGDFGGSFRTVSASFKQGDVGKTDVELEAVERFPLRGFVGVDDAGIAVIGDYQFFAGFDWANVFGLDQRLTYQYVRDLDFDKFSEHVGTYVIPLPWRHELTLFGSYADLNPDFSAISPSLSKFGNKGYFYQASARYAIPLPAPLHYDHEITAGFDYKRTDTPLLQDPSNPSSILSTNNINVAQFMLGYSGRLADRWGTTAIGLQGFYSPGGIGQYNTEADFNGMTPHSNPQYLYGRGTLVRNTSLPFGGFSWYLKAAGQLADKRLVATEGYSLGGWDTVRGYDQNVVSGDNGWLLVNEIRTPRVVALYRDSHGKDWDWIQGFVFCDY